MEALSRCGALLLVQLRRYARQAPLGAADDRGRHLQIVQQRGGFAGRSFLRRRSQRLEKQRRVIQNALADRRRALAPGGIQLPGLARIAVVLGEQGGHPLAVFQALARHRHQKLQGHLRQDLAFAHLLLDRFRQQLRQRQPARNPAHAAIEPARQLIEPVAEAPPQLRQ
jgi:hypothetical protein